MSCPKCNKKTLEPIIYDPGDYYAISGVSELKCSSCGYRECKWCHKELFEDQRAKYGCKGNGHTRIVFL